jgi:hypothetical protein
VHLAATDVHVVGERVRELRREWADLPANASQVVQEPRPLLRKLGQELGEPQNVDGTDSMRRSCGATPCPLAKIVSK